MYPNIHSITIYNSHDMEATCYQKRTQITNVGEEVKQKKPLYIVCESVN